MTMPWQQTRQPLDTDDIPNIAGNVWNVNDPSFDMSLITALYGDLSDMFEDDYEFDLDAEEKAGYQMYVAQQNLPLIMSDIPGIPEEEALNIALADTGSTTTPWGPALVMDDLMETLQESPAAGYLGDYNDDTDMEMFNEAVAYMNNTAELGNVYDKVVEHAEKTGNIGNELDLMQQIYGEFNEMGDDEAGGGWDVATETVLEKETPLIKQILAGSELSDPKFADLNNDLETLGAADLISILSNQATYRDDPTMGEGSALFDQELVEEWIDLIRLDGNIDLADNLTDAYNLGTMVTGEGGVTAEPPVTNEGLIQSYLDRDFNPELANVLVKPYSAWTGEEKQIAEQFLPGLVDGGEQGAELILGQMKEGMSFQEAESWLDDYIVFGGPDPETKKEAATWEYSGKGGPKDIAPSQEEADLFEMPVDYGTEFLRQFNRLEGSNSLRAQQNRDYLASEAELLYYLNEPWSSREYVGLTPELATPAEQTGAAAMAENRNYADWLSGEYFKDRSAYRDSDEFYDRVEELRDSSVFYGGLTRGEVLSPEVWMQQFEGDPATRGMEGMEQDLIMPDEYYDIIQDQQVFFKGDQYANSRLAHMVALYNTPRGTDTWLSRQLHNEWAKTLNEWIALGKTPESFLQTFTRPGQIPRDWGQAQGQASDNLAIEDMMQDPGDM